MNQLSVAAWVPFREHGNYGDNRGDQWRTLFPTMVAALRECLGAFAPDLQVFSVEASEPPNDIKTMLDEVGGVGSWRHTYVRIDGLVDVSAKQPDGAMGPREVMWLHAEAASVLGNAIEKVLMCTELATPSVIDTQTGIVRCESVQIRIDPKHSHHLIRFERSADDDWPTVLCIDLRTVVEWAARTSLAASDLPSTRIERTLAAFTHAIALDQSDDGEVLFRAMQGIEAFYCDGIGDLRKQVSEKTAIWLGRPPWTSNRVGHLYDTRSKVIHGAATFPYFQCGGIDYEEDKRLEEQHHASALALRMLTATLQLCITQNILDVVWTYQMDARSASPSKSR
jgi:hypothetical protein